jgi:hypothetical protein
MVQMLIDAKVDIRSLDDRALIMAYGNDYEDVFSAFYECKGKHLCAG